MKLEYIVKETDAGKTVKSILKNQLKVSSRMVKKLKADGGLLVNSQPVFVVHIVNEGDLINVSLNFDEACEDIIPEDIDIDIIYEDDHMIVLNKQPNMVVHPTSLHQSGTIANALMYYLLQKGIRQKIRPVSRLDRDTSGLIIFAKNAYVQNDLAIQMSENTFIKEYTGIVWGAIDNPKGTINLPIDRSPDSIMLRHVSETGKPSITNYEVLKRFGNATLLKFLLETGRTHQIRVHCQAIDHPIMGDSLYWKWLPQFGKESEPEKFEKYNAINSCFINRQALHSSKATFNHPITNKRISILAPMQMDMSRALEILENN